jgi:hypothetical protein
VLQEDIATRHARTEQNKQTRSTTSTKEAQGNTVISLWEAHTQVSMEYNFTDRSSKYAVAISTGECTKYILVTLVIGFCNSHDSQQSGLCHIFIYVTLTFHFQNQKLNQKRNFASRTGERSVHREYCNSCLLVSNCKVVLVTFLEKFRHPSVAPQNIEEHLNIF